MLIRSQDRKKIYNTDTMSGIWINRNCIYISTCLDDTDFLGSYTTEEKAIKVLDMIEARTNEPIYINEEGNGEYAKYFHSSFHMPQDDEVKL